MNYKSLSRIFDMSNLLPKRTGLAYQIWYGPKVARHKPRIKVSLKDNCELSIEIESHNVTGPVTKISPKELGEIFRWLDLNKDILLKYWNEARRGTIDNADVLDNLKRI